MNYKALYFSEFGSPELVIKMKKMLIPQLGSTEVLVEMLIFPINPSDLIPVTGAYAHRTKLPSTLGYEGVGVIKEVGEGVDKQLIGTRVLPLKGSGTWQEYVITSSQNIVKIPSSMDSFTAAQLYINPMTAWLICTKEVTLRNGDFVAVNACNSSMGRIFIQLSKILEFKIIVIVRNSDHKEELYNLGADYIIDTSQANLYTKVMEITNNRGVEVAIDLIGGTDGNKLSSCVIKNGDFIVIGLLSGNSLDFEYIAGLNIRLKIFHLRHWTNNCSMYEWNDCFCKIIQLVESDQLKLLTPEKIYFFDNYVSALKNAQENNSKSFVILNDEF